MLVLSRRSQEKIVINGNIIITVIGDGKTNSQIRIGIDAPEEIPVHRMEIHEKIQQEKENENDNQ